MDDLCRLMAPQAYRNAKSYIKLILPNYPEEQHRAFFSTLKTFYAEALIYNREITLNSDEANGRIMFDAMREQRRYLRDSPQMPEPQASSSSRAEAEGTRET